MNLQEHGLANNFYFDDDVLFNFHCSLQAKPFTILYGPSGTGKSKIAEVYADYICDQQDLELNEHFCFVPVRPNWTSPTDLMGFYDYLNDHFVPSELYNFMVTASTNLDKPYFLVLDEMNLSVVEHYFSDFLSCIESRRMSNSYNIPRYQGLVANRFTQEMNSPGGVELSPTIIFAYFDLLEKGQLKLGSAFHFNDLFNHDFLTNYRNSKANPKPQFRVEFQENKQDRRGASYIFEQDPASSQGSGMYKVRNHIQNSGNSYEYFNELSQLIFKNIIQHSLEVYKTSKEISKIEIPLNLYIIGTINMDESTQPLSSKVLDRANLIEMNFVSRNILDSQSATSGQLKVDEIDPAFSQVTSLATMEGASRLKTTHPELITTIYDVNDGLIKLRTNMGHRAIFEMCHYVDIYTATLSDPSKATEALDIQFSQKLIPKLMGSDDRVEASILHTVEVLTQGKVNSGEQLRGENMSRYDYPKTLDKLQRMFNYYVHNGFVNFANV
ncbi:McrB family protein [Photobacterium leiognathi]|uniref:McrB family protein n=1 Tax=Photobacterium leiognathi TaxID=553611 RepID=UPI002981D834|nr:AAA family ATPase [Photobacterium leiognathi]